MSSFRRRLMMQGEKPKFETGPCIYTTTSANQLVRLIYMQEYAKKITLEDGTDVPITGTGGLNYTFADIGEHKVTIEFKEDVTDLSYCFNSCPILTSIPEDLFANNTDITSFNHCFDACYRLTSIPETLFANNTAVTNFEGCFGNCAGLTSIPANLFASNTAVTSFNQCFYYCYGLTSIPENIFANNTAVTDFSYCFYGCSSLTGKCPIDNDGTPIYNRSSGKSGYTIVTSHTRCFRNCTKIADFASIPSGWR